MNRIIESHPARSYETATKEPNYALRRAVAGAALLGAGVAAVAGVNEIKNHFTYETIATETGVVSGSSTLIETVQSTAGELAQDHNIDPSDIRGAAEAGQAVSQELYDENGSSIVHPGQAVEVSLEQNGRGAYRVTADLPEDN